MVAIPQGGVKKENRSLDNLQSELSLENLKLPMTLKGNLRKFPNLIQLGVLIIKFGIGLFFIT